MNPRGRAQCVEWYAETKYPISVQRRFRKKDLPGLMSGCRDLKIPNFTRKILRIVRR